MNATATKLKVYTGKGPFRGRFVIKAATWDCADPRILDFATEEEAKAALAEHMAALSQAD